MSQSIISITPVAGSVPYNNANSNVELGSTVQSAIDELYTLAKGANGNVTPPFIFSYAGSLGANSYMQVGGVNSNQAGQIIQGSNYIVGLTLTTSQVYNMNQTIQLQIRTSVSGHTDITSAAVTIIGDNAHYSATVTFAPGTIAIGPNAEIAAYLKSGNGIANGVLAIYVVSQ